MKTPINSNLSVSHLPMEPKIKRGFALLTPEQRSKIAQMGGKVSGGNFKNDKKRASECGKVGGSK